MGSYIAGGLRKNKQPPSMHVYAYNITTYELYIHTIAIHIYVLSISNLIISRVHNGLWTLDNINFIDITIRTIWLLSGIRDFRVVGHCITHGTFSLLELYTLVGIIISSITLHVVGFNFQIAVIVNIALSGW